jgi:hypothetical protein
MSEIHKKAWPADVFNSLASGQKTYELRLADFEVAPGDTLVIDEVDEVTKQPTGRSLRRKVGYVGKIDGSKYWSQQDIETHGLQLISLLEEAS